MTMHLLPIYYNNNSNKKKKPFRKPGWSKAQAEHDKWLKSKGVHPEQLKNKEKCSGNSIPSYATSSNCVPTSDYIGRVEGRKTQHVYTGTYITGLATMHKSNTVPVGKGANAKDYAQMRRN